MMFRVLSKDEEESFRQWANENYTPHSEIKGVWHPVIQAECVEINKRNSAMKEDAYADPNESIFDQEN